LPKETNTTSKLTGLSLHCPFKAERQAGKLQIPTFAPTRQENRTLVYKLCGEHFFRRGRSNFFLQKT